METIDSASGGVQIARGRREPALVISLCLAKLNIPIR
jgi:hypothetical protein